MTTGDRIKEMRIRMNRTQTEVADACEISKQLLYKYENDIITNIPTDRMERIAKELETTPEYLAGWVDDPYDWDADPYDRIAAIPLSYMEGCHGNAQRAWKMMQSVDRAARNEAGPPIERSDKIDGAYLSLAKEAQDAKIDPEDISNFIKLLTKHRTDQ